MHSIVILLTGTIQPTTVNHLVLTSVEQREQEYLKAIKKWLQLGYPIIFCENSNYNSTLINEVVKNIPPAMFEYLKFTTNVSHLGKGNGETEIIEYVFNNSALIQEHPLICKATGKNYISNAGKIFRKISSENYSDKIVIASLTRKLTWGDSRFFFFTNEFYYTYLLPYLKKIDEPNKLFFEHALAKAIHNLLAENNKWDMLPSPLFLEGYSGTLGKKYNANIFEKFFKQLFHSVKVKMFATSK